eukprot:4399771-Alexandrium_andersonii.AAC.1
MIACTRSTWIGWLSAPSPSATICWASFSVSIRTAWARFVTAAVAAAASSPCDAWTPCIWAIFAK